MSILLPLDAPAGPQEARCQALRADRSGPCGRPLRDPAAVARGIGPDCWERLHGATSSRRTPSWPASPDQDALFASPSDSADTGAILDIFAGPGGWDEGYRMAGGTGRLVGIEWDAAACRTARAAGHPRIRADVAALDPVMFAGRVTGLTGSPPCTKFSGAGTGIGRKFLAILAAAVARVFAGDDCREEIVRMVYPAALADREARNMRRPEEKRWPRERVEAAARADAVATVLILEPARYVAALNPEWVALEQVPDVMPVWEAYARVLTGRGYSVHAGVLNAADYGVPQTRQRAVLVASRVRRVHLPEPTHAQVETGPDLFGGAGRAQWTSMSEALGWGFDEPSCTVSSGGTATGGAEPFANAGYRKRLAKFVSAGAASDWVMGDVKTRNGTVRRADEPSATIPAAMDNGKWRWAQRRPATTVQGDPRIGRPGHKNWAGGEAQFAEGAIRVTVEEAAVLQSFRPGYPWQGTAGKRYEQVGNAVPPLLAAHVLTAAGAVTA